MKICASVMSHPGKCREKNEDNFCLHGMLLRPDAPPKPLRYRGKTHHPILVGVFDGMGGMQAGERASRIAAEVAGNAIIALENAEQPDQFLVKICKNANTRTCDEMQQVTQTRMGSTASMLCFLGDTCFLCNVGDSPIFLLRNGELTEISHEHTEKENFIRIYGAAAAAARKKFKLTQYIGIFPEEMEIEPYTYTCRVRSGDRFLICSDGLTDMVPQEQIRQILQKRLSSAATVKLLTDQALAYGGKDNVTVLCADVKEHSTLRGFYKTR